MRTSDSVISAMGTPCSCRDQTLRFLQSELLHRVDPDVSVEQDMVAGRWVYTADDQRFYEPDFLN